MKNKALYAAFLVVLLWGMLYPLVKLSYHVLGLTESGDILVFTGMRFLIAGGIITAFAAIRQPAEFKTLKHGWLSVILVGFCAIALHYGFVSIGMKTTESAKTAILKQIGTVLYICFAGFFFRDDKLTWNKLWGLLLGISGILVINAKGGSLRFAVGDLLILAASLCSVGANIISKKAFEKVTPLVLTGISQIFGGSMLVVFGIAMGGKITVLIPHGSLQILVCSGILIASVVSYCLWYATVQKEHLSKLFIIRFSEPLLAAVMSWMMLGENIFRWEYAVAFLLISSGIIVVNLKKKA